MGRDGRKLQLFGAVTTLGWRVVRHRVSCDEGQRQVEAGKWAEVYDELNNHIGYQVLAMREDRGDVDLASQPAPVCITREQVERVAFMRFRDGKSRTIGLPEAARLERAARTNPYTGKRFEPEDKVERTIRKVQVYAQVGAARGDILRVWPSNAAEPLGAGA